MESTLNGGGTSTIAPRLESHQPNSSTEFPCALQLDPANVTQLQYSKEVVVRPISQQSLINEVKGFYAGLIMVEKKCVEITIQQSQSTARYRNQDWKALIALHRTLLHEHHNFFSASQHPTTSDALKRLAIKYAMPARMWKHGIHTFLELLRHRLPDSMEHMLSFIYLSYSMMALLKESVPSFIETWIECLGDLARYRMAIEDSDPRDREIWSNVARMWYNEAANKSPNDDSFVTSGRNQKTACNSQTAVLYCSNPTSWAVSFLLRLNIMCGFRGLFLLHAGSALALPTVNSTTPYPTRYFDANHLDGATNMASLAIPLILTPVIFLLGPKIAGIRNRVATSAMVCLVSTILIGVSAETGLPVYFTRTCSGVSLGFAIWLLLETRDSNEWPLLQTVRYVAMTALCHYVLQLLFLGKGYSEQSDGFLNATIWYWSFLGSVSFNGLCNPTIERIKICGRWLTQWRLERREL